MYPNTLYYGDNLNILREHMPSESVDLVYLDPPFNSNRNYNLLFDEIEGVQAQSQIKAFDDTWHWTTPQTDTAFQDLAKVAPDQLVGMINGFVDFMGKNDLTAYIVMLTGRLLALRRVLKPKGTLFLHCDPTAGHYIKIMLDCIFGKDKMINQFTWKRSSAHSDAKQGAKHAGRITDLIFWYAKGSDWTFNPQYIPYTKGYIKTFYHHIEEETGKRYALDNLTGPGAERKGNPEFEFMGVTRYWRYSKENMQKLLDEGRIVQAKPGSVPRYKRYLDEMPGLPIQDIWTDIKPVQSQSKESLGYPTQKPVALLRRIVAMASNPGDLVLDPFCGCGTTIVASEELGRRWIGIDITQSAIKAIRGRLEEAFPGIEYKTVGVPESPADAQALALQSRREFELWVIAQLGARPNEKPGADGGMDGRLFFQDYKTGRQAKIIVEVKSGKVGVAQIRALRGAMEREKAPMGIFVTLNLPTQPMINEAQTLGIYNRELGGRTYIYPRLQIVTIEALFKGQYPKLPHGATDGVKRAPRFQPKPEDYTQDMFANGTTNGIELADDEFEDEVNFEEE